MLKNLLVDEEVTCERKIRETILASRVESTVSKAEILKLYLKSALSRPPPEGAGNGSAMCSAACGKTASSRRSRRRRR